MWTSTTGQCTLVFLVIAYSLLKPSAQAQPVPVRENGIQVPRDDETVFSGDEVSPKLCQYYRDDGLLDQLQWLQNGAVFSEGAQFERNLVLSIPNATLDHVGEYSCRATLTNGTMLGPVSAGDIDVVDTSLIDVPEEQYVLEGRDITLKCSTSHPGTIIVWTPISDVTFRNASIEMESTYKSSCFISFNNGALTTTEPVCAVVIVPPSITPHNETSIQVIHETQISLTASFRSRRADTTTVTWERLDEELPSHAQEETSSIDSNGRGITSLRFGSLSKADSGRYVATVTNTHDVIPRNWRTASVEIELDVMAPPALPDQLSAVRINATHYLISWTLTHETPDEAASYLFLNLLEPSNRVFPVPLASSEQFTLEVEPGYEYKLSLTATNDDGSVTTAPTIFTTEAGAPLVTSVKAQRLNSTALAVIVELRYTGGGAITSVTLSFDGLSFPVESLGEVERKRWGGVVVSDQLDYLVEYSSDVQFLANVTNERSLSSAVSTQQSFIPPGAPNQPVLKVVSGTSFTLEVQVSTTGTEPLLQVVIEITNSDRQVITKNFTREISLGEVLEMSVSDLTSGYQYTVVVYAVNAGGRGPNSDPLTINTAGDSLPLPLEALIGIVLGACVVATILLILGIILCVSCAKYIRNKNGRRYCTADSKGKHGIVDGVEIGSRSGSVFANGYPPRSLTPRSPVISSRASSTLPPIGTDYSYEESEMGDSSVFQHAPLHKKQLDNDLYHHYQYRHSPAPLKLPTEHSPTFPSDLSIDKADFGSPPPTAHSYATDV